MPSSKAQRAALAAKDPAYFLRDIRLFLRCSSSDIELVARHLGMARRKHKGGRNYHQLTPTQAKAVIAAYRCGLGQIRTAP